jgi:hypothetical protein
VQSFIEVGEGGRALVERVTRAPMGLVRIPRGRRDFCEGRVDRDRHSAWQDPFGGFLTFLRRPVSRTGLGLGLEIEIKL